MSTTSMFTNAYSRRQLFRTAMLATTAGAAGSLLTGCATAAERSGGGTTAGGAKKTVIKFGYTAVKSNPVAMGYEKFAELLHAQSNGDMQAQTFCCNQLGNDLQLIQSVQSGALQMGTSSNNNLDQVTSSMLAMELPYLVQSRDHYRKVWKSGPGDVFRQAFEKNLGLKILMVMDAAGFRSVETAGRDVRTPTDLKGLKLRVAPSPVELATFRNWGANPVALPYNQVYTALQQRTVDGEVLQPIWFETDKHAEVAHNICDIRYIMLAHIGVMNLDYFNSLPPDQQKLLEEVSGKAEDYEWDVAGKAADEADARLKQDKAISFYEPLKHDAEAWISSTAPIRQQFLSQAGPSLVKQIEALGT